MSRRASLEDRNAITFYERYLNNTTEVIYEMIRDGEITIDTFKRAVYDLDRNIVRLQKGLL